MGARRNVRQIASHTGASRPRDEAALRWRALPCLLSTSLACACSIYADPSGRAASNGDGGSAVAGGTAGTGAGGSGATGSGAGGDPGAGGSSGQAGNAGAGNGRGGGAGSSGGSAGADAGGGVGGAGAAGDDGGVPDASTGGSSGGTDAGSSGGTDGATRGDADGGFSGGAPDADDARDAGEDDARDAADGDVDECAPEGNAALCLRIGKNCGTVDAVNNCGAALSVDCGSCSSPMTCGGAGQTNVCGSPTSVAKGGTVTASSPGISPEDMTKAFDENSATKWYAGDNVNKGWIAYQFASGVTRTVTSYSITSANDMPTRDPATWELQGSNDGQSWTVVDGRTGETFASRFLTKTYLSLAPAPYGHYRLNVTVNAGASALQLAELQLLGY